MNNKELRLFVRYWSPFLPSNLLVTIVLCLLLQLLVCVTVAWFLVATWANMIWIIGLPFYIVQVGLTAATLVNLVEYLEITV